MEELITSEEMRILEDNCRYYNLDSILLMENAGRGIAEEIRKRFKKGKIVIIAGKGNNAGDSFVAARHLKNFDIEIYLIGNMKSEIARKNLEILRNCGIKIDYFDNIGKIKADIVIDALLGTGFRGKLKRNYEKAIDLINSSEAFKISVDIPSGLNADNGNFNKCVKSDLTITFHKMKRGLSKAKDVSGEIVVKDIGIPHEIEKLTGPGDVKVCLRRKEDSHKGDNGKILVIGGSPYIGAPVMTSMASLKSGSDLVTLLVPESIYEIAGSFSPELIVKKLHGEEISRRNLKEIIPLIDKSDVVIFGMGTENKRDVAEKIADKCKKLVVDAGGLSKNLKGDNIIITPHKGEFEKIFKKEANEENVRKISERRGITILLKGRTDFIVSGDKIKYNRTGNAGMTVGGTGDILAGIVGSFFAKNDAFKSACAGSFINGLSGDLCFKEKSYYFTPLDVIKKIPSAIKFCEDF